MFGFAGWNFLTTCASMLSSQGVSILLNMHFALLLMRQEVLLHKSMGP